MSTMSGSVGKMTMSGMIRWLQSSMKRLKGVQAGTIFFIQGADTKYFDDSPGKALTSISVNYGGIGLQFILFCHLQQYRHGRLRRGGNCLRNQWRCHQCHYHQRRHRLYQRANSLFHCRRRQQRDGNPGNVSPR